MNKITVLLVSVLVLSACSDRLEHKNQDAIEALQSEVTTLKNQVVALEQNKGENEKPLSNIYIAPPEFKSELDARLANATIDRGIEVIDLQSSDVGGTDLTLISGDGRLLRTIHSKKDFSPELKPYGGRIRERISFLLTTESDAAQAVTTLKMIVLSLLEDKEEA